MKGLSRESRVLIDAARDGDEPSAADRRRVRTALARKIAVGAAAGAVAVTATHAAAGGVAAGTSSAAAGSAAAGAAVGVGAAGGAAAAGGTASITAGAIATGFGAKLLVTVAIVGAVGAGTVGYARHEATKHAVAETHEVARAAAPTAPVAPRVAKPASAPAVVPAPPIPVVPAPVVTPEVSPAPAATTLPVPKTLSSPVAPSIPVAPAAAPPSDLDVEIALLQDANGAIRAKDGARALRLLDEHARRFPNGALGEESEAARVFALCAIGRADEARDVAGRFLREHPRSPLAQRVSRACDAEPSTF